VRLPATPGRAVIVGVGARRAVPPDVVRAAVSQVLGAAGVWARDVAAVVTSDGKAEEAGVREVAELLGVPVRAYSAEHLDAQAVPNPSDVVRAAVGSASVAEAAVLAAGARLTHAKQAVGPVTVALGRLDQPHPEPKHDEDSVDLRPGDAEVGAGLIDPDLRHHGDAEVGAGLIDLAVNVRGEAPGWLTERLRAAVDRLAPYPDQGAAVAAVAARHRRPQNEVLLTAGAAEAFVLLARALSPRRAVVVHPQFTEPEAALRAAGHAVERVVLRPPFLLDPAAVPDDADLVVVGNPTNPTSVLHPRAAIEALLRPGRLVLVDEAFMDAVPGELESLAGERRAGLVVSRSLTKTWGLAGLRIGYLLGDPRVLAACAGAQPLWSVGTLALEAAVACSEDHAVREAELFAEEAEKHREALLGELAGVAGIEVAGEPRAPFVLIRVRAGVHERLRALGWAVRRADTFPGLGPEWIRVAVRAPETSVRFAAALAAALADAPERPTESTGRSGAPSP
jgi:histidinol-phosphate aminotransferase